MYKMDECSIEKFFNAVASGNTNRVRQLHFSAKHLTTSIRISPPQLPVYIDYGTAFHLAASMGHSSMLRFLWDQLNIFEQARIESQEKLKATNPRLALFDTITNKSLILYVQGYDNGGYSPLMTAISNNHYDAALVLLDMASDVNRRRHVMDMSPNSNDYAYTPLYLAVMNGNERICELLLQRGADPNTIIGSQGTALHKAIQSMPENNPTSSRIIELLLFYNANPYIYSGKKIKVAELIKPKNSDQKEMILKSLVDEKDYGQDVDKIECLNRFNKDPNRYRGSTRCIVVEDRSRKALFGGDIEYFLCMYSGPSTIELAESMELNFISKKLSAYGKATSASLALLKYARILFNAKRENNLSVLLKPIIIIILLHSANAFGRLTTEQVNACLLHAQDKNTLTSTKLSFLQKNVFSFFKDKMPESEDFLLAQYSTKSKKN